VTGERRSLARSVSTALMFLHAVSALACHTESIPPDDPDSSGSWIVSDEPTLRIGVLDGDPDYQFSHISAATRTPGAGWVVADREAGMVRAYDSGGRLLRLLGAAGSGPGEFVRPTQVLSRADGSIEVWDDAAFRATEFDSDGKLANVRSFSREQIAKAAEPPLYPAFGTLLSDGTLLVRLIHKSAEAPRGRTRDRIGALHVSRDESRIDPLSFFLDTEQVSIEWAKGSFPVTPPLARETSIATQPNAPRVCIGEQERGEVRCYDPGGSEIVVRWAEEPVQVEPGGAAVAAWRDSMMELYARKFTREDARRMLSQVPAPTAYPPYTDLVLDHRGRLWVKTGRTAATAKADAYLVFSPTGEALGTASVPPIRILEIGDDYLAGVSRDGYGVQYLEVFGITRPG
jgi:hypothetical protein